MTEREGGDDGTRGRGAGLRRLAPAPKEQSGTAAPARDHADTRGRGAGGRFATPCARAEGANGTPHPDRTTVRNRR